MMFDHNMTESKEEVGMKGNCQPNELPKLTFS
jgi:hypothetical protein